MSSYEWITPKTNWTSSDYYNKEDSDRVSNNLYVLKDMVIQLYSTNTVVSLFKVEHRDITNMSFYRKLDITPNNIYIQFASRSNILYPATHNFFALFQLYMLAWGSVSQVSNIVIDAHQPYDLDNLPSGWTPTNYYSGLAAVYGYTFFPDILDETWHNWFYGIRCPFVLRYSDSNNIYTAQNYSYGSTLKNKPFWSYAELNAVENTMKNLYTKFETLLGG